MNISAHRTLLRLGAGLVLFCAGGLTPSPAAAQEEPDSLRAEVQRLIAVVDSLRAEVERLRGEGDEEGATDALADLRAAAEAAAAAGAPTREEEPEEQEFVGRQRSLQALNPEISVNADVFAHVNQDDVDSQNFYAREFEISVQSNLDPFSRAKVFLARHSPGAEIIPFEEEGAHGHEEEGHGSGFAVEEGYVQWVNLGGIGLTLGRFFQYFGQLNRWHNHALPFQTRSLPHLAFIGEEALAQTGARVTWLAPFQLLGATTDLTLEVTRSENARLFGESDRPSVLGHLNTFWQISESTDLDLGLSWINGSYEDETNFLDRNLYGAEWAFTWRPPARSKYRGFTLRGGVMALDGLVHHEEHEGEEPAAEEEAEAERALGVWSAAELRLSQSWLVGGRLDWVENPEDPTETTWLFSPTLTWWQSEWVRLRAEYDLLGRMAGNEGHFLLQVTFAMGPHKHENY